MLAILLSCAQQTDSATGLWYADADHDGYGDAATETEAEDRPPGWVANGDDCDDADAAVNPRGTEVCDDRDQDCDGKVDDVATSTLYTDLDGDGAGDPEHPACTGVADTTDCDDHRWDTHPGAREVCGDDVDQDCDGADAPCGRLHTALTSEAHTIVGPTGGSMFGWSLATADIDGDGFPDLTTTAGVDGSLTVYAFLAADTDASAEDAWRTWSWPSTSDLGTLGLGDLDDDGTFDLVVASTGLDGGGGSGAVFVDLGMDGTIDTTLTDPQEPLGLVTVVADCDGDTLDEILVTREYATDGPTAGLLTELPAGHASWTEAATTTFSGFEGRLSLQVRALPDLTGEGIPELALLDPGGGSVEQQGVVYVFTGPLPLGALSVTDAETVVLGPEPNAELGAVADAGDLDQSGVHGLIVAAGGYTEGGDGAGGAFVFTTLPSGVVHAEDAPIRLYGEAPEDDLSALGDAADINGDAAADLLLGAPAGGARSSDTGQTGRAYVMLGPVSTGAYSVADADYAVTNDTAGSGGRLTLNGTIAGIRADRDAGRELLLADIDGVRDGHNTGALYLLAGGAW